MFAISRVKESKPTSKKKRKGLRKGCILMSQSHIDILEFRIEHNLVEVGCSLFPKPGLWTTSVESQRCAKLKDIH